MYINKYERLVNEMIHTNVPKFENEIFVNKIHESSERLE